VKRVGESIEYLVKKAVSGSQSLPPPLPNRPAVIEPIKNAYCKSN
jgi:hypothetical protein